MKKSKTPINKIELVKELRKLTGRGIAECRQAIEKVDGDLGRARKILEKMSQQIADKKAERETKQGYIGGYVHATGKIGVLLELFCETDFVARHEDFRYLAKEIAMQIAAMAPKNEKELLAQVYIREPEKTVKQLLTETIAKFGENIKLGKFIRLQI